MNLFKRFLPSKIYWSLPKFSEMTTQVKRKIEEIEEEVVEEPAKKIVKKTRKVIRPGFGEDKYSETEYYFENGE